MEHKNLREALEDPQALRQVYELSLARARGLSRQSIDVLNDLLLKDRRPTPEEPAQEPLNQ